MNHAAEKVNPDIPILIAEANFTHLSKLKRNFEELFPRNLNVTGRGYRAVELSRRQKYEVIFAASPLVPFWRSAPRRVSSLRPMLARMKRP